MKVNANKTTLLCMGASHDKYRSYIMEGNNPIKSSDRLKLLGFNFSDSLNVSEHIKVICKKVHQRPWTLIRLKRAGVGNKDILTIYKSLIRSLN